MNVLHVFAHPEPRSFNGAMRDVAVVTLLESGHEVTESDLYKLRFDAVAGPRDFIGPLHDANVFDLQAEQLNAYESGMLAADIDAEQRKIKMADLVLLQFPLWWFGMPAILKGWADRVFTRGFAYDKGRKYDSGLFRGKAAMVSVTTGTSQDTYAPDGVDGSLLNILWPVHNGLLHYCGFEVLEPYVVHMPGRLTLDERAAHLDTFRKRLKRLEEIPRLFFHPSEDYGSNERLRPGVVARSTFQQTREGNSYRKPRP